jgi:hypothetical protein
MGQNAQITKGKGAGEVSNEYPLATEEFCIRLILIQYNYTQGGN